MRKHKMILRDDFFKLLKRMYTPVEVEKMVFNKPLTKQGPEGVTPLDFPAHGGAQSVKMPGDMGDVDGL